MKRAEFRFSNLVTFGLLAGLICAWANVSLGQDDWSQWRGKNRDGVWRDSDIIPSFTANDLKPLWRTEIGTGYSSPTFADGKVFLMDFDENKNEESVRCFNSQTGEQEWEHTYESIYKIGYTAGPRASVTIVEGLAYALGAMGRLHCLDIRDGKVQWDRDLNAEYKIKETKRMPIWGIAASPLVHEKILILQLGAKDASVVGLDKETGKEIWRALDDQGHYSSPVMVRQMDKDVVVCWTGGSVAGINPANGDVYWREEFKPSRMPIGVATPVIKDNKIFLTSFYDGAMMLEMAEMEMKVKKLWHLRGPNERSTEAIHSIISTPIWIEDHIYGVDSYGELRCIRASDGSRVWEDLTAVKKSRWGTIHFVSHGDDVWMLNEQGELMIGQLSPEGLRIKSRASVLKADQMRQPNRRNGVVWSHPAYANQCVFLRNDSELICIKLAQ